MGDPLFEEFHEGAEPFVTARRPVGDVVIANADAAWMRFTHAAIEQAHRAIGELLDPEL